MIQHEIICVCVLIFYLLPSIYHFCSILMVYPALDMNTSGQCVGRTVHRKYVAG